jgi:thioredoxin-related protein
MFCYHARMYKKLICAAFMLATVVPAWAAEWMTDLEAAKAKAAAENKVVLVDFTGSDWCGWCIRLRKAVLDTPEFEAYAKDKFVLMEVDLPQNPKFDPALRARNEKIAEQYGVSGFPTIMVLTPQGELAGGFNGYVSSVAAASEKLNAALATAELLRKAESQQGAEKLDSLLKAYRSLPESMQDCALSLRKSIIALDPQDTTGLARLQKIEDQRAAFRSALGSVTTQAEALAVLDKALADAYPENKAGILQAKFQILLMGAQSVDDVKAAVEAGRAALDLDPRITPADRQKFDASFADPEAVFKRIQKLRAQKK